MLSSPVAIVALLTLLAAGLLIALIENWSRLAPIFFRWSWLFEAAFALWIGSSALEAFKAGDTLWGFLALIIAGTFAWSAATSVKRLRQLKRE
jgi:hypothetical protein